MLTNIFQSFPCDFVNNLVFNGPTNEISPPINLHTIGSLPQLCTMSIDVGSTILAALQSNSPVAGNSAKSGISFPSLQFMTIKGTLFARNPKNPNSGITIERLHDCLA